MAPKQRWNALIGQSGGPTAVINQSLAGIVEGCLESDAVGEVLGARHGMRGILEECLVDLGRVSREELEAVARTPASALGSVRQKPTRADSERMLKVLHAHHVRYLFYIGGNDTAQAVNLLDEVAGEEGYDLRLFHVPKTIDNDLMVTDHCPGYPSAARVVTLAMMGDDEDNRSLPGVKINIIMGRHAGWLTAASCLSREREGDGPHLVYVPENVFEMDAFLGAVEDSLARHGRCQAAVSEGIHDESGKSILDAHEVDVFGNLQLSGSGSLGDFLAEQVRERLGKKLRVRADTYGYLQRSFFGVVSEVDAREAREVGRAAVRVATTSERKHGSLVILREEGPEYRVRYDVTDLASVAARTRVLQPEHLAGAHDVTESFREWVQPLVGSLPRRGRLDLPEVARKLS
jgi:6-phosphofructokinase 1